MPLVLQDVTLRRWGSGRQRFKVTSIAGSWDPLRLSSWCKL